MAQDKAGEAAKPRRLSLQVPKDVNLSEMSDAEIERLALDMSRKVASTLPRGSTLAGVEGVTLNQSKAIGIGIGWSRSCDRAELSREGLVVNPEVFSDPIRTEDLAGQSARITINAKQRGARGAARKSKKK